MGRFQARVAAAVVKGKGMEAVGAVLIGAVLFMHGWQLFGLSAGKTTGVVGLAGAIALLSLAMWKPYTLLTAAKGEALATSIVVWAVYAALVAAVGLWDVDARGLGLYAILAAVAMIGQIIYCAVTVYVLVGIICGVILAVAFGILFLYLAIPLKTLRQASAWVLVVVGALEGLTAGLMLLKVPGLV